LAIGTLALLLLAGIGAAGTLYLGPQPEQLVEGHTVFSVLETVCANCTNTNTTTHFATAIAVLVRDVQTKGNVIDKRFPGVLWFNDQYLVDPSNPSTGGSPPAVTYTYPGCGVVIVVNQGDPDPTQDPNAFTNYVESYHITDPNDHPWDVDKWMSPTSGAPIWTVGLMNTAKRNVSYGNPTCGTAAPASDATCAGPDNLPVSEDDKTPIYNDSGTAEHRSTCEHVIAGQSSGFGGNPYGYPCGGADTDGRKTCSPLSYNAVLFMFLDDLTQAGTPKDHTPGSFDYTHDASGCQPTEGQTYTPVINSWPCPGGDDNREGNSHPYNPRKPYPVTTYDGKGNHGGSADCTGDGAPDMNCHATRLVDVYYGAAPVPTRHYAFNDVEGSTAPYYCEPDIKTCNQHDLAAQTGAPDVEP
jgi:hypothetical protein